MTANNIISEDLKILVFRSDIDTPQNATFVQIELQQMAGVFKVDVDIEDSENVLRVECHPDSSSKRIKGKLVQIGFTCSEFI